jgi:predicted RNA-binding Zn-ribbon protein involved in translation (DUF1610 family)
MRKVIDWQVEDKKDVNKCPVCGRETMFNLKRCPKCKAKIEHYNDYITKGERQW